MSLPSPPRSKSLPELPLSVSLLMAPVKESLLMAPLNVLSVIFEFQLIKKINNIVIK
jgi:hypothetical protein